MEAILDTVTIDQHPAYQPMAVPAPPPNNPPLLGPPADIQLHEQARWFLDRAPAVNLHNAGIGFCGILAVHRTNAQQPGVIYLWPLQTPHEEINGVSTTVPGMEDLHPWPEDEGWPAWVDQLQATQLPVLELFRRPDKNLHVFARMVNGVRQLAAAHAQLYQAIRARDNIDNVNWRIIGFTLYYNLNYVDITRSRALEFQHHHHLLRLMSRSQNSVVFPYPEPNIGKVPTAWANAIKDAFDAYFNP